jgi:hypothetical protein
MYLKIKFKKVIKVIKNLGIVLFLCICLAGFCLSNINAGGSPFEVNEYII